VRIFSSQPDDNRIQDGGRVRQKELVIKQLMELSGGQAVKLNILTCPDD
jgi:hypothetical protein